MTHAMQAQDGCRVSLVAMFGFRLVCICVVALRISVKAPLCIGVILTPPHSEVEGQRPKLA